MTSETNLGWRRGLMKTPTTRITITMSSTWRMNRGREYSSGLSPCHTPLVVIINEPEEEEEKRVEVT
ncbi:unnamed protein product [Spirodela intermedia]|uniref:Uncharacterized protein n=1 Tax=Spirodela intermedia TaxID=51605 RepID=A0A7I8INH1_SPIIN|nr:unnamed protein product [Spirodela intermedia]CAA6659003.1 unnamed protein product [Spirodela intermedia]